MLDDKNLGGRPRKEIDFDQLKKLCVIHCTKDEICGFFEVDEKTLTARIEEKHGIGFSDYFKIASAEGKSSLRRKQFELALKGNVGMLIWLGKQILSQSDRQEIEHKLPPPTIIHKLDGSKVIVGAFEPEKLEEGNDE